MSDLLARLCLVLALVVSREKFQVLLEHNVALLCASINDGNVVVSVEFGEDAFSDGAHRLSLRQHSKFVRESRDSRKRPSTMNANVNALRMSTQHK